MASFNPEEATPAEIVAHVREAYGLTWQQLGAQIGRSEKMLRKVAKGQSSGEAYRAALTELYREGRVTHRPARRRAKDGHIVKVRAKRGAAEKSVEPPSDGGTYEPRPKRGHFSHDTTYLPEGGRMHQIELPKTRGSKGRAKGLKAIKDTFTRIAKGQRGHDKRVKMRVLFDVGDGQARSIDIGSHSGYHSSDVLADIRNMHGGDVEGWLVDQVRGRYPDFDATKAAIVHVDATEFTARRTKTERKEQDELGIRRKNRDQAGNRIHDPRGDRNLRHRRRKTRKDFQ